jgi:hypothetical protein
VVGVALGVGDVWRRSSSRTEDAEDEAGDADFPGTNQGAGEFHGCEVKLKEVRERDGRRSVAC